MPTIMIILYKEKVKEHKALSCLEASTKTRNVANIESKLHDSTSYNHNHQFNLRASEILLLSF